MKIRDRIKSLKRVTASELLPNPKNWRQHPDHQADAMRGILAEVGFADAALARETPDGLMLIDGHLRAELAPDAQIPVLVLDVTDEEADKILATHDSIATLATSEQEALSELLDGMKFDHEGTQAMIDDMASAFDVADDLTIDEGEASAPPKEPITQKGDVIFLGQHRLICGDCRNPGDMSRLMEDEKIAVAITSPPYASQRKYDEESGFKPIPPAEYVEWFSAVQENIAAHLQDDGSWFLNIKEHCSDGQRDLYVKDLTLAHVRQWGWMFVDEFVWTHSGTPKAVQRRFKNGWEPIFQFCRGPHKFRPKSVRHKTDDVPDWEGLHPNHEDIQKHGCKEGMRRKGVVANKKRQSKSNASLQGTSDGGKEIHDNVEHNSDGLAYPSNVLSLGKNREALGHSAAFPVSLPVFFIRAFSDPDDVIFDPFMGSGTTLVAAEKLNRTCHGVEISPAYCDVIVDRWQKLTGKKAQRNKKSKKKSSKKKSSKKKSSK